MNTYLIISSRGEIITASRDENEAREIGQDCAEFNPSESFYLQPETLN